MAKLKRRLWYCIAEGEIKWFDTVKQAQECDYEHMIQGFDGRNYGFIDIIVKKKGLFRQEICIKEMN